MQNAHVQFLQQKHQVPRPPPSFPSSARHTPPTKVINLAIVRPQPPFEALRRVRRGVALHFVVKDVLYGERRGAQALQDIQRRKPDLILTDISMPRIDGFGLLQALRSTPETARIPVVAITVNGEDEDVRRGIEAGFTSYLTKPIDTGTLAMVVAGYLNDAHRDGEPCDANRLPGSSGGQPSAGAGHDAF